MAYIGSSAAPIPVNFSAVQSQGFNGTGSQTAFTMARSVATPSAIEVLVNNVQQSPFDGSYTVLGTTLTFSEAPSTGTNNVYVIYRDQPVGSLIDTGAVRKSGDTMSGPLKIGGASSSNELLYVAGLPVAASGIAGALAHFRNDSAVLGIASFAGLAFTSAPGTDYVVGKSLNSAGSTKFAVCTGAGNELLAVDGSGRLAVPNQPAFMAFADLYTPATAYASEPFFNAANSNPITTALNVGGYFSASTGRFTAPIAGSYFFEAAFSRSNGHATLDIFKNGVSAGTRGLSYGTDWQTVSASAVIALAAGDYVQIKFGGVNGTTTNGYSIHFCGHLIG